MPSVLLLAALAMSFASHSPAADVVAAAAENSAANSAEANAAAVARIKSSADYLSSDQLEGRGIGSQGLNLAADYLAEQFKAIGLKTELFEGQPFQKFTMTVGAKLGAKNELKLEHPAEKEGEAAVVVPLKIGTDASPLALGGSGELNLPLVFVGYGITAKKEMYDDYAQVDVKGKAVIALRHEPQQNNPHSLFEGSRDSQYAPLIRKISNAYEHGAAAVIFVTDETEIHKKVGDRVKLIEGAEKKVSEATAAFLAVQKELKNRSNEELVKAVADLTAATAELKTQTEKLQAELDPVMSFDKGGVEGGRNFPVLHVSRGALDPLFRATLQTDLATLEKQIDEGPTPKSCELPGCRILGQVSVERTSAEVKNVVGVLEGAGSLAGETLILGAHYDHVGRGGPGSGAADPNSREIHNGADDNASGSATLVEVARRLVADLQGKPNRRRLVFIAFTGEERGLIGSAHYVRSPLFELEQTVAMLNMDMVGRLRDDKLIIEGIGTAEEFNGLIDQLNGGYGFKLTKKPGGFGPSDHASFYAKKIPVMHFFTDTHKDYHRPSDDADKLNTAGMQRVGQLVGDVAVQLAEAPARPKYVESKAPAARGGGDRPYFGSIPDFSQDKPGYALMGVTKDGPAEKAGIRSGDIIIQLGESRIGNLEDFDSALRKFKGGDKVPVTVDRGGKNVKLEVTLEPPR